MAKKSTFTAIAILLLATLAGVFVETQRVGMGLTPSPARSDPAEPRSLAPPRSGHTVRLAAAQWAGVTGFEKEARRSAADVFPGADPRVESWRYRHPTTLLVAPYGGQPVTFQQVKVKEDGRHLTWIGRNQALPGASYVGIATPDGYDAILLAPGGSQINLHVRAGQVLVEEVVASGRDCELGPESGPAVETPGATAIYYSNGADAPADPRKFSAVAAPLNVDVLFLYNSRALALAAERSTDPVGYLDGYSRAALETANLVLQNSRVDTFAWRYVGLVPVPEYPEKVTVSEDLLMIAPDGPFADLVREARTRYGADQVLLWTGAGVRKGSAFGGETRNQPVERGGTVAALRLTAGTLILAHELAHNFGCHHDRGHAGSGDGSVAQPEGDGFWCYGLLWNDPGAATTSGTVMSYADFLVPYYSNPNITLNVTSTLENRPGPLLSLGTQTIGFPESDPRAANNVRILNDHAAYIASESVEAEAPPVILQQPQDIVAIPGQSVTFTVSAVGGGLNYQWTFNGTILAGATSTSYSLGLTQADIGGYSVTVTNSRGAITSRVAAVSLTVVTPAPVPAQAPPAVPAASSNGGGGGGAPSVWFYASLLVLYGLRRWRTG